MRSGPDVSVKDGAVRRKGKYEGLREKLGRNMTMCFKVMVFWSIPEKHLDRFLRFYFQYWIFKVKERTRQLSTPH